MAREMNTHYVGIRLNKTLYDFVLEKAESDKLDISGVIRKSIERDYNKFQKEGTKKKFVKANK